jgi:hypothetical protein
LVERLLELGVLVERLVGGRILGEQ